MGEWFEVRFLDVELDSEIEFLKSSGVLIWEI